jgi:predicted ester cyclase
MDPLVSLVRRWAVDWLSGNDPSVCDEIMAPSYSILIGGFRLEGRDAYVSGTVGQLNRFPGLGLTIHELIASGDRVALRFTEHGASEKLEGRRAAWGGVALFRWNGRQLTECFAEEDYLSRRRQLDSGECDPIEAPAPAPWNTVPEPPDPVAEDVVRRWLKRGDLAGVDRDDSWLGHEATIELDDVEADVNDLFSAGNRIAFHGVHRGRFAGAREPMALHLAGLVTVQHGEVVAGRVVRDRLGLQRALSASVTA